MLLSTALFRNVFALKKRCWDGSLKNIEANAMKNKSIESGNLIPSSSIKGRSIRGEQRLRKWRFLSRPDLLYWPHSATSFMTSMSCTSPIKIKGHTVHSPKQQLHMQRSFLNNIHSWVAEGFDGRMKKPSMYLRKRRRRVDLQLLIAPPPNVRTVCAVTLASNVLWLFTIIIQQVWK